MVAIGALSARLRGGLAHGARFTTASLRGGVPRTGFGVEAVSSRVEKRAEALLRASSSLLVFQSALSGEAAQAFLKTLVALRAGRDGGMPALQAYGTFFSKLAAAESTWVNTLLDGVISSSNAFSLAAAKGEPPSAALRAAAASDLEVLQQLCVAETTLAAGVREAADAEADEGDGERWLAASAALSDVGAGASGAAAAAELDAQLKAKQASPLVGAALSAAQKSAWRDRIGSRARWRDGVDELALLYRSHGAGIAIDNAVLTWRDGSLTAAAAPTVRPCAPECADVLAQISRTLMAHQVGTPNADRSVLIHGDTQYCSDIAWTALLATGCRAVVLPRGELKMLPALLDALRAHPRTPYVVVAEMLSMVLHGEAYYALFTVLELDQLPPNVLLLATSRHESMLRPGEVDTSDEKLLTRFEEVLQVLD